jgi:transposase-like protein
MRPKLTCIECGSTNCEINGTTTDIRFICKDCEYEKVKAYNDRRSEYMLLNERITWAIFLGTALGFVFGMVAGICLI